MDLRGVAGLWKATESLHEWASLIFKFRPEAAHPAYFFFFFILIIQPKGFSDDLRGLPSWVSVHFTRSPAWQNYLIKSILILLPLLHTSFLGFWPPPSPAQTSLFTMHQGPSRHTNHRFELQPLPNSLLHSLDEPTLNVPSATENQSVFLEMPSFYLKSYLASAGVILNQQSKLNKGLKKDSYFVFTQGWRIPFLSSPYDTF